MSELNAYKADVTIPVYGTIADAEVYLKDKADAALSEKDKEIARQNIEIKEAVQTMKSLEAEIIELKDKCQMHDFFWEGCGFAKRGFKNTIAVSEAFDKLEAENVKLKTALNESEEARYEAGADAADYYQENRKLKRALYKACANWARSERYTESTWHGDEHREELWAEVEDKCLKKAEEYK